MKKVKSNDYKIISAYKTTSKDILSFECKGEYQNIKNNDIFIMDLLSTGSVIVKNNIEAVYKETLLEDYTNIKNEVKEDKKEEIKEEVKKEKIEPRQINLDDFYQDFKI